MRRCATVYERRGIVYLHASSQTVAGVWIASEPFLKINFTSEPQELGVAVLQALARSKNEVPHPQQHEWKDIFNPVLKLANVRYYAEFERQSRCCEVEVENEIVVIPYRQTKHGYEPIIEKQLTIPDSSTAAEIGRALIEAFALCD